MRDGSSVCGRLLDVALDVLGEVVRPHEPSLADRAGEPLLARVGAPMSGQLVRPREPPAARAPRARERSLARVRAPVGLKVRRLEVVLGAAGLGALEYAPSLTFLLRLDLGSLANRLSHQHQVCRDQCRTADDEMCGTRC